MLAAQEKLHPLLKLPQSGTGRSWRDELEIFRAGGEGPLGSVNLSPAWFQQGHDVGASENRFYFLAAHYELGNRAGIPTHLCELQFSCCIGLAKYHLGIQCSFKCNPGSNSSKALRCRMADSQAPERYFRDM